MTAVLHITTAAEWEAGVEAGAYQPAGFAAEGFVHCSTLAQIARVAHDYYAGVADLVVLVIDEARVTAPVRYEVADVATGEAYPHIYGVIDPAWVVTVQPLDEIAPTPGAQPDAST